MSGLSHEELDGLFEVALPPRPYPGLRPFEAAEWPIFFGRERMADEVVTRLLDRQLVVVHGDSGCGKSSLIRAGVMPRLEHEHARGGVRWRTCAMLPREGPLAGLARAIAGLDGREGDEGRRLEVRRVLNFGRDAAASLAAMVRRDLGGPACVLVDQFEELFEHARRHGPEEARLLTDLLVGLLEQRPDGLYFILTMRSEFLGGCARFRAFAETVNATQYLLPRMAHADLVRAIREPALLYDGEVTPDLAERLIADAGGGQDQLPLIQHGLMLLHREKLEALGAASAAVPGTARPRPDAAGPGPSWRLSTADYRSETGLGGLLSAHADAVQEQAEREHLDGAGRSRVVEDLFRALTDVNPDGQGIRRPCRLSELVRVTGASEAELRGAVDTFRADGVSFLNPYGSAPLEGDPLVDISHEALIRCWQRLADPQDGWLLREFRNGLVWRSLLVQADSFDRNPDNVLSAATTDERARWLERRNAAWAERYGGGWERVVRLASASVAARDRDLREQEEERRHQEQARLREQELEAERKLAEEREKRLHALRWRSAVMSALLVVACALGVLAWQQAASARSQARKAEEQAVIAQREKVAADAARDRAIREAEEARLQFSTAQALREEADQRAAVVEESADALRVVDAILYEAGRVSPEARDELARAQRTLKDQVERLEKAGTDAPPPQVPAATEPRVYIHIVDESQRPAAVELEAVLEGLVLDGETVVVPGIQLVKAGPRGNELRCFSPENCKLDAPRIVRAVHEAFGRQQLEIVDLSARYGTTGEVRPGVYEIWFGPGPARRGARAREAVPPLQQAPLRQAPAEQAVAAEPPQTAVRRPAAQAPAGAMQRTPAQAQMQAPRSTIEAAAKVPAPRARPSVPPDDP